MRRLYQTSYLSKRARLFLLGFPICIGAIFSLVLFHIPNFLPLEHFLTLLQFYNFDFSDYVPELSTTTTQQPLKVLWSFRSIYYYCNFVVTGGLPKSRSEPRTNSYLKIKALFDLICNNSSRTTFAFLYVDT